MNVALCESTEHKSVASTRHPAGFNNEEVSKMVKGCIEARLGGQGTAYSHSSVSHWTAGIVEDVLKQLSSMNDNYK